MSILDGMKGVGQERGALTAAPPPSAGYTGNQATAPKQHHDAFSALGRVIAQSIALESRVRLLSEKLYGPMPETPTPPQQPYQSGLLGGMHAGMEDLEGRLNRCEALINRVINDLPQIN